MEKEKVEEFVKVVQDIKKSVHEIKTQVERIEVAVSGDPAMGFKGIVPQNADFEIRIAALEKDRTKVLSIAGTVSFLVGLLSAWIFKHF